MTPALATSDSLAQTSSLNGVRVLVAEDNTTNQKVALRMLDTLGCHADAVFNGREVLNMLDRFRYNVVLMDVQMPEMDGYLATTEIRHREQRHGRHVPVIAMTAHAMKGDRERCLAAGMDDYLGKPVTYQELASVLERWCSPTKVPGANTKLAVPADQGRSVVFQFERLRDVSDGDSAAERDLLQSLLEDCASSLSTIRAAFAASDATRIAAEAHHLLGACRTVGADSMANFCQELEQRALSEFLPTAIQTLTDFQVEYDDLRAALAAYMQADCNHLPCDKPRGSDLT